MAQMPLTSSRKGPIFTRQVWTGTGNVEVAVFDRQLALPLADDEDGAVDEADDNAKPSNHQVFNVVAKRTWKDGKEYKSGNSFRPEDLLPLALFLQEAYSFIASQQMNHKKK